jgi:flagellar hook-associated protein 3 FlgL
MRITTNGTLLNYKSDLMRSSNTLSQTRNRVLTGRQFSSYAEDPAAATMAFKLRRQFSTANDQLTNIKNLKNKYDSAWSAVDSVKSLVQNAAKEISLKAINDPTGGGRQPLGTALTNTAESIVQTLNSKYGDAFIFAGNDGMNVPFSWDQATGDLLFRGIPVDSTYDTDPSAPPRPTTPEFPPNPSTLDASSPAHADWVAFYNHPNNSNYTKLIATTYETAPIDIGAGLSVQNGVINNATVFNSALSALSFIGFGEDADGDPQNAVSLIKQLGSILSNCDADGTYANDGDAADVQRLTSKLEKALSNIVNEWTDLDGETNYLQTTEERLTENTYAQQEQISGLEQINLADAITDFSWAQYCYNAALRVGSDIVGQSLIDFMR